MIISVANRKGGVGKTTTSLAIINWLHRHGVKVLGIDLDAQRNLTSTMYRGEPPLYTSYSVLLNSRDIDKTIIHTPYGDLIPGSPFLVSAEKQLQDDVGRAWKLKEAIETLSEPYEVIVIDCPPSLGTLVVNALTASDKVIIPVQADKYSLNGVLDLYESLASIKKYTNPNIQVLGWVMTRFNGRTNLARDTREVMGEYSGDLGTSLFQTSIRENVALKESQAAGMPIFEYAPRSNGAIDYNDLCEEIFPEIAERDKLLKPNMPMA